MSLAKKKTTIKSVMKKRSVFVALMGRKRYYLIGDMAYRFHREDKDFPYAIGCPVMWIDGRWRNVQREKLFLAFDREITLLDD